MKTVAKINPELEYENAKNIIELAVKERLSEDKATSLDSSVENLITAARVLMEREERRRGRLTPKKNPSPKGRKKGEKRGDVKKLPSERYPDLEIEEKEVRPNEAPVCPCCDSSMKESSLFNTTEKLEVIPKRYYISRKKYVKFTCGKCHGSMLNTPVDKSIVPTSNYGDGLIIDVAISKYCDLIPIERYAAMAGRQDVIDLPPQSLIGLTHHLSNFLFEVVRKIKREVQSSLILLADETPHKMLEGDIKKNWYLWGFFCKTACYFEAHNTRSGDVIKDILKDSDAEYLVSDGYTGYSKAIRETNEDLNRSIREALCNAHSYRYFKEAGVTWKDEVEFLLKKYGEIYELERNKDHEDFKKQLDTREKMIPLFEQMKSECTKIQSSAMPGSGLMKSVNYFLNHYDSLTVCTKDVRIPLDNNLSERNLRSPVVGRKTWLGTHSKRGAKTNADLFTIVQSCKINNVNPRSYFPWVVQRLHDGLEVLTPYKYSMG